MLSDYICSPPYGLPNASPTTGPNLGIKNGRYPEQIVRYYYDSDSNSCRSFMWYQQGGDFNNFESPQDCQAFCIASMYHCANHELFCIILI